jgi:DNA (cytosine-5)-methyltransferase 1
MRFISLFAGVGGFDLGMERAGHECVAMVEYDKQAAGVLAHRFAGVPLFCDVRQVSANDLPDADFITYGFPCQDLSMAGKRKGLDGDRSGLFFEATRIIRGLRKRGLQFALAENVAGLLSADDGGALARCVRELLDCGARDVGWRTLDSQYFGVAQRRRRVFLIASFGGGGFDEILALAESLRGHPAPRREVGKRVAPTVTGGAPFGRTGNERVESEEIICRAGDQTNAEICEGFAPTLNCNSGQREPLVFQPRIGRNGRGYAGKGEPVPALNGSNAGATSDMRPCVAIHGNQRGELREASVAPALASAGGKPGQGYPSARVGLSIRRLTPRECERLQGFPDDWTSERAELELDGNTWRNTGKVVPQSDTSRYKQMGNAVTVNVAEWIGRRMCSTSKAGK